MSLLEAVSQALSEGKSQLCIVCDPQKDGRTLISRLERAFGPVPLLDHDCRGREPGIWDLCCAGPRVHFVGWAAALAGRGFDAIIVTSKDRMEREHGSEATREWIQGTLGCRLLPGGWLREVEE